MTGTKESFTAMPVAEQVERLSRLDAKSRQDLILSVPNSLDLTRSLSPEALFYTAKEVGLASAVDLLALASPEQIRVMVDLDCWRKDSLDDRRLFTWLMLLDETGSGKLLEWLLHVDAELLVLLVKRHLYVVRKVDVSDERDFDESLYFSFDDQYLLRFIGEEQPIVQLLLERLRRLDYNHYRGILESSLFETESSLEESALHWRNGRLADRGYPSHDEAQELFRFVAPESLSLNRYRRTETPSQPFAEHPEEPPPNHALLLLRVEDSFLVRTLRALTPRELEQIGQELACLSNQVVVAEGCDPGEISEVRRCVESVHHYLNIGLCHSAQDDEVTACRLLREIAARPFLQIGVSLTLRLHQMVRQLDASLRQRGIPGWMDRLDSPFRETCSGVWRRPPRFFAGLATPGEVLNRRFQTLVEVRQVEAILTHVPLWFAVMQRWQLLPKGSGADALTLGTLWNTAFARWLLDGRGEVKALSRANLAALQERMRGVRIEEESTRFLAVGAARSHLTAEEEKGMRALASNASAKLDELLRVDALSAEPRFVEGILFVVA